MKRHFLRVSICLLIAILIGLSRNNVNAGSEEFPIPRISPVPSDVIGMQYVEMNLDGSWKFLPLFERGFEHLKEADDWSDITVPGEWSMQGYQVGSGNAAGYFRTFSIPANWTNKRIKLRFNGVYSESYIYVNGREAGSHLGGFTAFELDITDLVKADDQNTLILSVKNESLADSLSSGSRYACHPLGGISRSVSLFVLPEIHFSALAAQTQFDEAYKNATLTALFDISNESITDVSGLSVIFELSPWRSEEKIPLSVNAVEAGTINAGKTEKLKFSASVKDPMKWDCENPNLYVLTCKLEKDGEIVEIIRQRFGFRQSEVKGNQLFVNGKAVKLRGVNRHEVYPLTGRVVPGEMYRKDIELFREGNVNHIRTCHYPPDEKLMEAADELGMFIECEGPFCWSHDTKSDPERTQEAITSQLMEMIVLYRNHPSIIFWSIANESDWTAHYDHAGQAMAALDPTRPITFNFFPWSWGDYHTEDEHICKIGSDHYPGPGGPSKYADYNRPISFGEFAHLNAYNRYELATDVALRDKWGIYLHGMWEDMYNSKGCAGGSIWAGIDDTFYWDFVKNDGSVEERTVGYGTWGPIDGWRRRKPEWWGMKKTYSPVRVSLSEFSGNKIILDVENRQDFSNLDRLIVKWQIGEETGTVSADAQPKQKVKLLIEPEEIPQAGAFLELAFDDPRGFNIDAFKFLLVEEKVVKSSDQSSQKYKLKKDDNDIIIKGKKRELTINAKTGLFQCREFTGPYLMILPLNGEGDTQMHGPTKYYEPFTGTCTEWKLESIETENKNGLHVITVRGSYKEAEGSFIYAFHSDGSITIEYNFLSSEEVSPRQIGIVFELPGTFELLSWKRNGYWSTYPDWHIARLEGTAIASEGVDATPVGPRTIPHHEWKLDRTAVGSNDFASTKHNIYRASLTDKTGYGLEVLGNADIHTRSWIEGESIRMLIANYSNGGSERFLRSHAMKDDIKLNPGDQVKGKIKLMINQMPAE